VSLVPFAFFLLRFLCICHPLLLLLFPPRFGARGGCAPRCKIVGENWAASIGIVLEATLACMAFWGNWPREPAWAFFFSLSFLALACA